MRQNRNKGRTLRVFNVIGGETPPPPPTITPPPTELPPPDIDITDEPPPLDDMEVPPDDPSIVIPKSSDESNNPLYLGILFASGIGTALIAGSRLKKKYSEVTEDTEE